MQKLDIFREPIDLTPEVAAFKGIKFAFVHHGHDGALLRLAGEYFVESLNRFGFPAQMVSLHQRDYGPRVLGSDVVIYYRFVIDQTHVMQALHNTGKITLVHTDDHISHDHIKDLPADHKAAFLKNVHMAMGMSACNPKLLEYFQFKEHRFLRTSGLSPRMLDILRQPKRNEGPLRLAVIAGPGRKFDVEFLQDLVRELNVLKVPCVLHYFGSPIDWRTPMGCVMALSHPYVACHNPMEYYNLLRLWMIDVVVNHADEQNSFMHCKAHLKMIEAGALNAVLVTSRITPYLETIEEGMTGFFASTPGEFADKISKLAFNRTLLWSSQAATRSFVERHFNMDTVTARFLGRLIRVFGGRMRELHIKRHR